ncbi:unnamed protein product [Symbiodinium natans]|uniref:Phospholipase/carboxylesterase/thioesterase domain-containing protein n=1 Tax=Symbiodinium natans TaxID=878477 RepID=A0A812QTQ9_9DINO|nr:unnamed protein product [Symbiodinium natans]
MDDQEHPPQAEEAMESAGEAEEEAEDDVPQKRAAKAPPAAEDRLAQEIANLWLAAPGKQVSSAVIWLHHQGESEAMQQMLFRNFQLPEEVGRVRWLWPRAPLQPSSIRGHSPTLQWFDIKEYPICRMVRGIPDRPRKGEDGGDVSAAVKRTETMVRALEVEGIPRSRILLGGFGQGAALVLRTVLQSKEPLAGGVVCSGWVAGSTDVPDDISEGGRSTALLWCHGARDDVVEPRLAAEQAKALKEAAEVNLRFVLFPEMQFELASQALSEIQRFIAERLLLAAGPADGGLEPG